MLAVAKMPHIEFSFKGPKDVLIDIVERLKGVYPVKPVDSEDWFETDLYKKIKARVHGGTCLRTDLFNAGVSQKVLAQATGIPQPHISQMISGKRPINPENAATFANYFNRPAKRYRVPPSAT
jgi:predicted XRE-type DNA-binding protein